MPTKQDTKATVQESKAMDPTYTVEEFANAPESVGAKSPDIVRAALKLAGKETATVEEAMKIVKAFKNKEVK